MAIGRKHPLRSTRPLDIATHRLAAWRETYYAAHRTAPFPQRAFVPSAMALAVVGYARNVSYGRKASSGLLARDWRNVASGVLGVGIAIVTHHLVKRQDWVAQVAVENKARVRLAPQVLRALAEIRRGHVAIALALMLLVALQMSVAVDQVVEARLLAIHENGRAGSPPKSRAAKKL